jgi:transposase
MKAFPIELRERVLKAVREREGAIAAVATVFSVSVSFIFKLLRQLRDTGGIAPKAPNGGAAPLFHGPLLERLRQLIQAQPDATLAELREKFTQPGDLPPSLPMICRALQGLGLPRKRKKFFARERNLKKRAEFSEKAKGLDAAKLVVIDEMGVNINLTRAYARAPKGQRVEEALPRNTPQTLSVAGALGADKLLASCALEGAFDGEAFSLFIEHMVAPQLKPGDWVLMDNGSIHKSPRVEVAIKAAGAQLLDLPAYSPDFVPIEPFWGKVKTYLRKVKARTLTLLEKALGPALNCVTTQDIRNWYVHCGYNFT